MQRVLQVVAACAWLILASLTVGGCLVGFSWKIWVAGGFTCLVTQALEVADMELKRGEA